MRSTEAIGDVIPRKHDSFYEVVKEMMRADPARRCSAAVRSQPPLAAAALLLLLGPGARVCVSVCVCGGGGVCVVVVCVCGGGTGNIHD